MSELSIFVDESGDFGKVENNSPYYLVSLVFHNQSDDIYQQITALENALSYVETDRNIFIPDRLSAENRRIII